MRKVEVSEVENQTGIPFELTIRLRSSYETIHNSTKINEYGDRQETTYITQTAPRDVYHYVVEFEGDVITDPNKRMNQNGNNRFNPNENKRIRGFPLKDCTDTEYGLDTRHGENGSRTVSSHGLTYRQADIRKVITWTEQGNTTIEAIVTADVKKLFKVVEESHTVGLSCLFCDYPLSIKRLDGVGKVLQECNTTIRVARLLNKIPDNLFKHLDTIPTVKYPDNVGILDRVDDTVVSYFNTATTYGKYCVVTVNMDLLSWVDVKPYYLMED